MLAGPRGGHRGVHEAEGSGGQEGGDVKAPLRPTGHDVDHSPEAALVPYVERSLRHLHSIDLGEIDVEGGRVHPVGAGPVDALAVDQDVEVPLPETADDEVVGDPPLADLPHPDGGAQGLPDVLRAALAQSRRLQGVARSDADDLDRLPERGDRQPERDLSRLARAELVEGGVGRREARRGGREIPGPGCDP